jgi:large subunit ribosomal protein L30
MIAIVRVRGLKNVRVDIRDALKSLNLDRKNNCVLVSLPETSGMLEKVRDYAAFGKVKTETIAKLVQKRGRLAGDKAITAHSLKVHNVNSFTEFATAVESQKMTLKQLGIKPVFRLNSPKKGYGKIGIKKPTSLKGPLGFHPEGLDEFLQQMM